MKRTNPTDALLESVSIYNALHGLFNTKKNCLFCILPSLKAHSYGFRDGWVFSMNN